MARGAATSSVLAHPDIAKPRLMNTAPPIRASRKMASRLPATWTSKKTTATVMSTAVCRMDTASRVTTWAKRKLAGLTGVARSRRRIPSLLSWTKAKATLNSPICMMDMATIPGSRKSM